MTHAKLIMHSYVDWGFVLGKTICIVKNTWDIYENHPSTQSETNPTQWEPRVECGLQGHNQSPAPYAGRKRRLYDSGGQTW